MSSEPAHVDFFYGIGSRYSYLASTQIEALERDTGCRVNWRPLYSGKLIAMTGANPFAGNAVSTQYLRDYREKDAARWAAYLGVPYLEPPAEFIHDPAVPNKLALACTAAARLRDAAAMSRRLFSMVFAEPDPDASDESLAERAREAGYDRAHFLDALGAPETAAALDATTQEAHDRGAFGVPTFFIGDELFWGNDRLVLVRDFLARNSIR
jgi:2-hydroxychromene-2-carboxylate isomerase